MSGSADIAAYQRCLKALLLCMSVRLFGLLTMATLLAPGLDFHSSVLERASFVANHPWLWRFGWLPWQLTAVWDVLLSLALLIFLFSANRRQGWGWGWALVSLLASLVAFWPDQWAQYLCVTSFIPFAEETAAGRISPEQYVALESQLLLWMGTYGCAGYTLMAWCWMRATAAARPGRPGCPW